MALASQSIPVMSSTEANDSKGRPHEGYLRRAAGRDRDAEAMNGYCEQ